MQISNVSRTIDGILLITIPSIEFGGAFLLRMIKTREPGYLDNPVRQKLFRAGHAHAGVLVILSLVMQVLADALPWPQSPLVMVARLGAPCAAILMPLGFFLSVAPSRAEKPNGLIALVYAGALTLALSTVLLGLMLLGIV
jgi:hypothetical protein